MSTQPTRTTSMVSPLMLRRDMPRETATAYRAGPHAEKFKTLPNVVEYNQRLFSCRRRLSRRQRRAAVIG